MDFYKKLKATKPSNSDNIVDILSEVEHKLEDMQPVIHASIPKVQKTLSDIKTQVDSLKNLEATVVSVDQQERIKEIARKYKEISSKYSDVSISIPQSPKPLRRNSPDVLKNRIALPEVEEKLKSMRQKRLDRLSVFVAEQSKLSEERSHKSNDYNEIEDAIKSIQKTESDKKIVFKRIEENLQSKAIPEEADNSRYIPKLSRTGSNESTEKLKTGKSSTLRFINKLNCTGPLGSSEEDLTADVYDKAIKVSDKDKEPYIEIDSLDNPLLSPIGKQRKAVYMYDHECQFLEKEKRSSLPPLSTFGKSQSNPQSTSNATPKIHTYENHDIAVKSSPKKTGIIDKNRSSTKSLDISEDNRGISTVKTASDKVNEMISSVAEKNKDGIKANGKKLKINIAKSMPPSTPPLRSPLPLPRRSTHAERVLKKVQRNWENLNEILDNDSDVDGDEIEDFRKTWEEADALLREYKARITKLDRRTKEEVDAEKLKDVQNYLEDVRGSIRNFKGLKRDSSYMQLSNRLSNYFLDVSKMNIAARDKQVILEDIDRNIKELEGRVVRNEAMLMEILDMQARSIGTNYLCITKV